MMRHKRSLVAYVKWALLKSTFIVLLFFASNHDWAADLVFIITCFMVLFEGLMFAVGARYLAKDDNDSLNFLTYRTSIPPNIDRAVNVAIIIWLIHQGSVYTFVIFALYYMFSELFRSVISFYKNSIIKT